MLTRSAIRKLFATLPASVKLTERTLEGGAIRISMTGRRAVKLTQSPIPRHSFVQAVIATDASSAICFV